MSVQRRGMRALEIWCQRVTSSYPNVEISDLAASFKDGLAFCAIIHHFRPDLIDYESLKADQAIENNDLAFRVAEEKLGIPSLLDPEDMVNTETPDKFSVATYLAQFYHLFKDEDDSRNSSPNVRVTRGSESSENGSSGEGTPLGTPTLASKSNVFNSKRLLEKYGAEIFESSAGSNSVLSSTPSPKFQSKILTPKFLNKSQSSPVEQKSPSFSRKDLIEKYGEEIFAKSGSDSSPKISYRSSPTVESVCKDFEIKTRVSSFEKQQS